MNDTMQKIKGILKESKYTIPAITIMITLAVTLIIAIGTKSLMSSGEKENISIANNPAEEYFYNKNYESAISEYEKLQEKESWPIYTVKIAEIYSIKGEYIKANELLRSSYDARNKIVDSNSEYSKERDIDLLSNIVFDYLMNNENTKALEYGELFMQDYPNEKSLQKVMLAAYMSNNKLDEAKEIVENYDIEDNNDMIIAAKMNFIVGNFDKGLKLLEEAWNDNGENIKVFDALNEISDSGEVNVLSKISKLEEKNPENDMYKMWKAELYLKSNATLNKAEKLIEELETKEIDNVDLKLLKAELFEKQDKHEESQEILEDIIHNNENTFVGYYAGILNSYNNQEYAKSFEYCKKLIIYDRNYNYACTNLMPQILSKLNKPEMAEPYFLNCLINEPFNSMAISKIAAHYNSYTDTNNALSFYNIALKMDPDNSEIYYNMALINIKNQRQEDALKLLKKSISLNDNKAKYYRTIASVYLDEKKNESALANIRAAYELDKNDALTLNNAGYYYIKVDNDVDRSYTNFKAAYEGISDNLTDEQKNIITDNYNLVKSIYNDKTKISQASELKLFY